MGLVRSAAEGGPPEAPQGRSRCDHPGNPLVLVEKHAADRDQIVDLSIVVVGHLGAPNFLIADRSYPWQLPAAVSLRASSIPTANRGRMTVR